jgi:hypothetical protein
VMINAYWDDLRFFILEDGHRVAAGRRHRVRQPQ